jgi:hypothetical protein
MTATRFTRFAQSHIEISLAARWLGRGRTDDSVRTPD